MSNFNLHSKNISVAAMSLEQLDIVHSTEDLKTIFGHFITKVKIAFGAQEAMAKRIDENKEKFRNLFKDVLVRTVMPEDLIKCEDAMELLTKKLAETRMGELAKFEDSEKAQLEDVGIDLREDGDLYASRFTTGNWGEGKDKTGLKGPMTFKKKIGEFKWETYAPDLAERFVDAVRTIDSRRMEASLTRHYKDYERAVASAQQKAVYQTDNKVAWNISKNMIAVRYQLIKFIYSQLAALIIFAHEDEKGNAVAADPYKKHYA